MTVDLLRDKRLLALLLLAAVARLLLPELRPIHHDEAVNWFKAGRILREGHFTYDAANYHGPITHYVHAWARFFARLLRVDTLTALRLPAMLAGLAMVPVALRLKRPDVAVAVAFSPTLVVFSRDAIHEIWLALFSMLAIAALFSQHRHRLFGLGAAVGAMLATKETLVITLACWGAAALAAELAERGTLRRLLPPLLRGWKPLGLGFVLVVVPFFAGFGGDPGGLVRLGETLAIWTNRGLEGGGHSQPWTTMLRWLVEAEPAWLLAALFALPSLRRPADAAAFAWFVTAAAVYAAIPYKTPWCLVQIALPLTFLAGRGLANLAAHRWGRFLALLLVAGSIARVVDLAFVRYDEDGAPLVYVQTHRELHEAMGIVLDTLDRDPDATVRTLHHVRYPMNWYLRHRDLIKTPLDEAPEALSDAVLLVAPKNDLEVRELITRPYLRKRFRLRDGHRLEVWLAEPSSQDHWERIAPVPRTFEPPAPPGDLAPGWHITFHPGRFEGEPPFHTESAGSIDRAWANDDEKPEWGPFYVRHEAWVRIDLPGRYAARLESDDGSRLWIDGRLVVDNWGLGKRQAEGSRELGAGLHHVRVDWSDRGGPSHLRLRWKQPDGGWQPWPAERTGHRRR